MPQQSPPAFTIVSGPQVERALAGRERQVIDLVEAVYTRHDRGETINPPSYFLRFPDRPSARIIALPASLGGGNGDGDGRVDGLKWISSFPANVASGRPRASAVLILNDPATGVPYACLEGSVISASRTAASAALAADWLTRGRPRPRRLGLVGAGVIAGYAYRYLRAAGWEFDEVGVHDLIHERAVAFGQRLAGTAGTAVGPPVVVHQRSEDLLRRSDLVVFATVAGRPHVADQDLLAHHPLILHLSLRDLAPELVLSSVNVVDDVDHCLRAGTSVHLAEQLTGQREHVTGTLADVMASRIRWPDDSTVIFSPFGLGVLDLALGLEVYRLAQANQGLTVVDDFFGSGA
jgi:N-[(2S)-2-amino-2-carboxyethyl]-L-glutamate dehydrogenase